MALAGVLFALVVIGALVAGNFFAGRLEQQSGQNIVFAARALEAAEAGLSDVLSNLDASGLATLSAGGSPVELGTLLLADRADASRQISRLTATLYLIRSTGVSRNAEGTPLATRAIGLIARVLETPSTTEPTITVARLTPIHQRAWVPLY